jgi:eukaryotic-like serine/threonine-protein kinase
MTPAAVANGRYQLREKLGSGGMATVYLADDPRLGREVALKLLAENIADDADARRRFEREARLAAKLDHPNVVQVYDVGEEDGRPFIVMEYVGGGSLSELIGRRRRRRPSDARKLELLAQACDGLAHAHRLGLVHRDIKPANLLLRREDGRLKIADFGIAVAAEEAKITRTGLVLGTKPYMAPEQLEGQEATSASDVYALGVVGRELFADGIPTGLDQALDRATARDPRERYRDAAELGEALDALGGGATTASLTGPTEPVTRASSGAEPTVPTPRVEPTPPAERVRPTAPPAPGRRSSTVRRGAALVAAAAVAIAVLLFALDPGGGDEATQSSGDGAKAERAPKLADPEQQARALADWLRRQSR